MSESIIFKNMDIAYLDKVMDIEINSFTSPFTRSMIENELTNPRAHYLVGLIDCECVAYGGFWQIFDEAHIISIAVATDYRRNGYGEQLVIELMRNAIDMGVTSMTLEVRKSNIAAKSLYTKLGFIVVGERREYYPDNKEDALIMWNYNILETIGGDKIDVCRV